MFDDERNVFKPEDFEEDEEFFFGEDEEENSGSLDSEDASANSESEEEDSDSVFEDGGNDVFEDFSDEESNTSGSTADEDSDNTTNDEDENSEVYSGNNEDEASDSDSEEEENQQSGREIGIDLGTTNSVIAYIDKNGASKFVKVKNESLIPSFIFFKDRDTVYYGKKAKSYAKAMSQGASVSLFKKHLRADSEKIKVRIIFITCGISISPSAIGSLIRPKPRRLVICLSINKVPLIFLNVI